jgi:Xaa-Pro dipeptidase
LSVPERELWFPIEEYRDRVARVQADMRSRDIDVLLAFHPASVTWLTGFFTTAYMLFSVAVVPAEGDPTVVCRDNEEYWLRRTGAFDDVVFWVDGEGGNPAAIVRRALGQIGATRARIGIESAFPYGIALAEGLRRELPEARFEDLGAAVIASLREIKSPAEIELIRAASRAVEAGTAAGIEAAHAGATERDVAAAISSALILAGSDVAGPGPMGSGERARHLHATFENRVLQRGDTLVLEVDGCVHHYYSRFFRTIKIGEATAEEQALAARVIELQDRAWSGVRAGAPAAAADAVLRSGIEALTGRPYTNNSFGSIGLTLYPPAAALLAVAGSDWRFEAGMTFHSYAKVNTMFFSETLLVTNDGYERLTCFPRELVVTPS